MSRSDGHSTGWSLRSFCYSTRRETSPHRRSSELRSAPHRPPCTPPPSISAFTHSSPPPRRRAKGPCSCTAVLPSGHRAYVSIIRSSSLPTPSSAAPHTRSMTELRLGPQALRVRAMVRAPTVALGARVWSARACAFGQGGLATAPPSLPQGCHHHHHHHRRLLLLLLLSARSSCGPRRGRRRQRGRRRAPACLPTRRRRPWRC